MFQFPVCTLAGMKVGMVGMKVGMGRLAPLHSLAGRRGHSSGLLAPGFQLPATGAGTAVAEAPRSTPHTSAFSCSWCYHRGLWVGIVRLCRQKPGEIVGRRDPNNVWALGQPGCRLTMQGW